jgi:peptidoglycan/xylan/chitin deacetylase (PgdA/CDA1 family)
MPATVFVAPGLLGGITWWDYLADASGGVIPNQIRSHAIEQLQGDRDRVIAWFEHQTRKVANAGALPRIANESELASAAQQADVTFGAHSWSHRNLRVLAEDELTAELLSSLTWLRRRFPNTIPWLTYPYGLAPQAVETASSLGQFRGAFMFSGGWMSRDPARLHALPRLGVPAGLSANGLSLRLAGIASNR